MKCVKCGSEVLKIPMKNAYGEKGCYYYCNACHQNFYKSPDGDIADDLEPIGKNIVVLAVDMSEKNLSAN